MDGKVKSIKKTRTIIFLVFYTILLVVLCLLTLNKLFQLENNKITLTVIILGGITILSIGLPSTSALFLTVLEVIDIFKPGFIKKIPQSSKLIETKYWAEIYSIFGFLMAAGPITIILCAKEFIY